MSEQYFTANPTSDARPAPCTFSYRGQTLRCMTDAGVFSRGELDYGTRALLEALPAEIAGRVLDLGCGWGAVGVAVGKCCPDAEVVMSDVNARALALAQKNAAGNGVAAVCIQSDGFEKVPGDFDLIVTNPPIRAGKEVIYRLFGEGTKRLRPDGEMWLVIRKQQGAASAMRYLETLFEHVTAADKSGGFWTLRCARPRHAQETGSRA